MEALGLQVLFEFYDCQSEVIDRVEDLRRVMVAAAKAGKATVVNEAFHAFSPQGVSGVLVIAESHLSVHTWPEHRYAAVDVFTCGDTVDIWAIKASLEQSLQPRHVSVMELRRGLIKPRAESAGEP